MEAFYIVLGVAIIYSFVHGAIIVGKKIQDTTQYENVVLIFAVVCVALLTISAITQ